MSETQTQFISYLEDNGKQVDGYFEVTNSEHPAYIEFKSHGNIIKIPWHRVLKNKVKEEDDVD